MVKVTGFKKRTSDEGREFYVLVLQGGIQTVKSKVTGKQYITAVKANMVSTFSEQECREAIGTKLPGSIVKQNCSPYDYVIPQSGEKIQLDYTYVYSDSPVGLEENVFAGE